MVALGEHTKSLVRRARYLFHHGGGQTVTKRTVNMTINRPMMTYIDKLAKTFAKPGTCTCPIQTGKKIEEVNFQEIITESRRNPRQGDINERR